MVSANPQDLRAMPIPPQSAPVGSPGISGPAAEPPMEPSNTGLTPLPPLPVFQFNPPSQHVTPKLKRTQCKNACTNCQKACKKCDDNRPCQRCTQYGTTDTCVDSKRKERKKGIKRGPYKKRDGKDHSGSAGGELGHSHSAAHGPPPLPFVRPSAMVYPPGMWGTYAPVGHNGKLEAMGCYQPVFALTPIRGPLPQGSEGTSASGGNSLPSFPFSFYPAAFVPYPGFPYPIPQASGTMPPGFFAYPAPGLLAQTSAIACGNNDQGSSREITESDGNEKSSKDLVESQGS